jgi:hypothetical protein
MKKKLSNVTLIGIDCVDVKRLQIVMDICERDFEFGAVKMLSSLPIDDPRLVVIEPINSVEAYSDFCFKRLSDFVETDFVLIVQYDGFILNPSAWTDAFLQYDYIGAPWLVAGWSVRDFDFPKSLLGQRVVGNGGFSLRSKKFLLTARELALSGAIPQLHPEDVAMVVWHRDLFEKAGIKIAPPELAKKFSLEGNEEGPWKDEFGFHDFKHTDILTWLTKHPDDDVKLNYPRIRVK